MKNKKIVFFIGFLSLSFLFSSCGKRIAKSYVEQQQKLILAYNDGNFSQALKLSDSFVKEVHKSFPQDLYVALLERGKIALDSQEYDLAIEDLQEAEERFLDIEGTLSLSEEGSSLFLDDTTKEYEAEPLEKLMISPYLSLAYLGKGNFEGARIERNRTMTKINQYIESTQGAGYLENPFARYLSGVLYEKEKKFNDARIEYQKIKNGENTPSQAKEWIDNELQRIKKPNLSDLVVFVDVGKSPMKFEKKHGPVNGVNSAGKGVTINIVYADMNPRKYQVKKCKVLVNGEEVGETILLYNLGQTILTQFQKNSPKLMKSLISRAIVKTVTQAAGNELSKKEGTVGAVGTAISLFSAVSSAIERADLRSWITLPGEVQVFRAFNQEEGEALVQLIFLDAAGNEIGKSDSKPFSITKGDIAIAHFRVVR